MTSIMDDIVNNHADLTLVVSLEHIQDAGNGRLNRLIKQAVKEAIKEAGKLQLPPLSENNKILDMFEELKEETGWDKGARHPLTFVNFCLMILEDYNYRKLCGILIEIMVFFERGNNAPAACFWAAPLAFDKWDNIKRSYA